MRIETEAIRLGKLNLEQVRLSGQIVGAITRKNLILKRHQFEMLNLMEKGFSIEGILQHFLSKKILISFGEFKELLKYLVDEELIINENWKSYFQEMEVRNITKKEEGFLQKIKASFTAEAAPTGDVKEKLKKIPFLRSLSPEVLEVLLAEMRVIDSPAGIAVCTEGQLQRSLFVMLQGQAAVVKKAGFPAPRKVATITDGAVFGEVGFFMGEARTADVITEKPSTIVRLKYQPEKFDHLISQETARNLQKRFWVIHALMKSKTFSSIPDDCFDALVFAGELRLIPADTFIFRQGDEGDSCYLVIQGDVVVVKDQKNIRVLGQGESFGEVALLINHGKRSAGIKAQKETLVLEIPVDKFYQLLMKNIALGVEFEKIAVNYTRSDLAKSM